MIVYRVTMALLRFLSRRMAKAATRQAEYSTTTAKAAEQLAARSKDFAQNSMKAAKLGQKLDDLTGE